MRPRRAAAALKATRPNCGIRSPPLPPWRKLSCSNTRKECTGANLGWGCLDETGLREIMQLHTAQADLTERTPLIARMDASNLIQHILDALQQHATGKPIPGAPGKPGDRALFLVGHDTNIATVAGLAQPRLDHRWPARRYSAGRRPDLRAVALTRRRLVRAPLLHCANSATDAGRHSPHAGKSPPTRPSLCP